MCSEKYSQIFKKPGQYKVAVYCGTPCPTSQEISEFIFKNYSCDFMISWVLNLEKKDYVLTFRSKHVDVGEIAAALGGGGHKLAGALDAFPLVIVEGKRALDAGASTGGFTDVLLRRGASEVVAVDVGYGQLAWELRQDSRVKILDRTNIRHLTGEQVGEPVDLIVADLSFISLTLVLPALAAVSKPEADYLLMVKPQFEVGREHLGAGGVVRTRMRGLCVQHRARPA